MTNLEEMTRNWQEADNEYKNVLFKNALLMVGAELAVIGFLLQNEQTQILMKYSDLKLIYILSFVFASISLVSSVLYKRFDRRYNQHTMHIEQYVTLGGEEFTVFGSKFKLKDSEDEKKLHINNATKAIGWADKIFSLAEICLGISVVGGVLFVGTLLFHL